MTDPIIRKNKNIGNNLNMTVYGGLRYINGNKKPHFSITAEIEEGHREYMGGCCHEEILRIYPELSGVVAMHLSDIDGEPMYSVENGYYWLTALQGENQYEKANDKNCLKMFAEYVRVTEDEARKLKDRIKNKGEFTLWVESQKARWLEEAKDCIKNNHLVMFGDYYKPVVP